MVIPLFLIATCAIIFVTISQLANAGWYVAIRRIPEAMSRFMPFGALVISIGICIWYWLPLPLGT
jgi:hypothetical protein